MPTSAMRLLILASVVVGFIAAPLTAIAALTPTTTVVTVVNPQGSGNTTSTATSVRGQPVSVTFAVTAGSGAAAPDGSVSVYVDGFSNCTVVLGSPVGLTATGTCNLPAPLALGLGLHTITASYTGTATFAASASSGAGNGSLTVMNASTTTVITAHTPDPSMVNSPIAVTAVVTVTPPGVADGNAMPVQVSDGSVTCMLPPTSAGQPGTCNLTPTTGGTKTLVATFLGQGGYNGSASPGVSHTVSGGGTLANYQGMWWNAPANSESGWGINLAHQGDTIFAAWFTYDTMGRGWWLVMTATKTRTNTYSGKLYQTRGPAFNAVPFDQSTVVATEVGTGTLVFTDANNGTFNYVMGSTDQTKTITREVFGTLPVCTFGAVTDLTTATNYQDLWWRTPENSESGWGINLAHQGDTIVATWFTYDLTGAPLWLVVTAVKTGTDVYTGDLYQTSGPAFNAVPFDASKVVATKVGTATFTVVDGNNVTLAYSVQLPEMSAPAVQTKPITREIFTAPGTVCQ